MNNYKIRVNNEAESREAQELFFELGYRWNYNGKTYFEVSSREILAYSTGVLFQCGKSTGEELTLPQLRDLVVLHRNDVNDATHSCDGMSGAAINLSGSWYGYNYNEKKWQAWDEIEDDEYKISDLKPIQKPQPEQGLISGADALRALADGEEVEYSHGEENCVRWTTIRSFEEYSLDVFLGIGTRFKFRLKPRTLKLEIEVPAPFEPKDGDECFILNSDSEDGFHRFIYEENSGFHKNLIQYGAWRTVADIKIVVEQLHKLKEHSR